MARAWALISISENRQYKGNLGYADDPTRKYRYDSSVQNHLQVAKGDLVFIRDRQSVVGMACISQIEPVDEIKLRLRCPTCGTSQLSERQKVAPKWRCTNGHTFDAPAEEYAKVKGYEASYASSFIELRGQIQLEDLKHAALRPSNQVSIEEIDVLRISSLVEAIGSAARDLLSHFLQARHPDAFDAYVHVPMDDLSAKSDYLPSLADTRERLTKSIVLRRGQQQFRRKLLKRYGQSCMVTGCALVDLLDAAHIWPYRGSGDNHLENGLVLRTDIHTLFDLDLLGVHPDNLEIQLHPSARASGYDLFNGIQLCTGHGPRPSRSALTARWASFTARL